MRSGATRQQQRQGPRAWGALAASAPAARSNSRYTWDLAGTTSKTDSVLTVTAATTGGPVSLGTATLSSAPTGARWRVSITTTGNAPGIGLAAIQIGMPLRVVTLDVSKRDDTREPMALINPEIVSRSDDRSIYEEGCLSIPDYYAEVERPASITVKSIGRDGKETVTEADGLLATCLQHEIDHLNGVLFIDHISRLKREMVIKKFTKAAKGKAKAKNDETAGNGHGQAS